MIPPAGLVLKIILHARNDDPTDRHTGQRKLDPLMLNPTRRTSNPMAPDTGRTISRSVAAGYGFGVAPVIGDARWSGSMF